MPVICTRQRRTINPVEILSIAAVDSAEVLACLGEVEARDPLVVPISADEALNPGTLVARDSEGTLVGVGWRREAAAGTVLELRVDPRHRLSGVGSALLDAVGAVGGRLLASCDGAHPRAGRFLARRGFELAGVVLLQRWDGAPEDVPASFRTADLRDETDRGAALSLLLGEAPADAWPPPLVTPEVVTEEWLVRGAWVDGELVGVLVAVLEQDAWVIGGCVVRPEHRGRGIGRGLVTDIMGRAAAQDLGVTLRVDHRDEHVRKITQTLGFWTFRTWAYYLRDP